MQSPTQPRPPHVPAISLRPIRRGHPPPLPTSACNYHWPRSSRADKTLAASRPIAMARSVLLQPKMPGALPCHATAGTGPESSRRQLHRSRRRTTPKMGKEEQKRLTNATACMAAPCRRGVALQASRTAESPVAAPHHRQRTSCEADSGPSRLKRLARDPVCNGAFTKPVDMKSGRRLLNSDACQSPVPCGSSLDCPCQAAVEAERLGWRRGIKRGCCDKSAPPKSSGCCCVGKGNCHCNPGTTRCLAGGVTMQNRARHEHKCPTASLRRAWMARTAVCGRWCRSTQNGDDSRAAPPRAPGRHLQPMDKALRHDRAG